jgi:hypothetical protein
MPSESPSQSSPLQSANAEKNEVAEPKPDNRGTVDDGTISASDKAAPTGDKLESCNTSGQVSSRAQTPERTHKEVEAEVPLPQDLEHLPKCDDIQKENHCSDTASKGAQTPERTHEEVEAEVPLPQDLETLPKCDEDVQKEDDCSNTASKEESTQAVADNATEGKALNAPSHSTPEPRSIDANPKEVCKPRSDLPDYTDSICAHVDPSIRKERCESCGYCPECYNLCVNRLEWRECGCKYVFRKDNTRSNEPDQVGQGASLDDDDDIDIDVGFQESKDEIFDGWSRPLDFPKEQLLDPRLLELSTTSPSAATLIEEYLTQDIHKDIIPKIMAVEKKNHQICLRNQHLRVCGRIAAYLGARSEQQDVYSTEAISEYWNGHIKAQTFQHYLRGIHPDVLWRDWDQIKRDMRENAKFCIHVNAPGGCRFGATCHFSHSLEGLPCPMDRSLKRCPRGNDCFYVHSKLSENLRKSYKRPCPYLAQSGVCPFEDRCYHDHSSYEWAQRLKAATTMSPPPTAAITSPKDTSKISRTEEPKTVGVTPTDGTSRSTYQPHTTIQQQPATKVQQQPHTTVQHMTVQQNPQRGLSTPAPRAKRSREEEVDAQNGGEHRPAKRARQASNATPQVISSPGS